MSRSANPTAQRVLVAAILIVAFVVIARSLVRQEETIKADHEKPAAVTVSERSGEVRAGRLQKFHGSRIPVMVSTDSTTSTRSTRVALTGFVVDDFRWWTAIPTGYHVEGVELREGALTLSEVPGGGGPRTGFIVSPALELWQPALGAPVENPREMPEGTEVFTEIRLSRDGLNWSGWTAVGRHHRPDGRQVQPPPMPTWSGSRPQPQGLVADTAATSGPLIRYRLTLTSQNSMSPLVEDLRIWRNPNP